MLASDSDSEFEFPAADWNQSEASDDGLLFGKQALGVDPQDMKAYDGRSTPKNGSQYLMKVMAEKKAVPKVVSVDADAVLCRKEKEGNSGPYYLDRFLQFYDCGDRGSDANMLRFLPSPKWREETVSSFSLIRSRIENWQYKLESREIKIHGLVQFPQSNDNVHWLKFCFGDGFSKLLILSKGKTKEEKLSDFFEDIYDGAVTTRLVERAAAIDKLSESADSQTNEEDEDGDRSTEHLDTTVQDATGENKYSPRLGHRPLMNLVLQLNQVNLERLVKFNLGWVEKYGFLNECQGMWLYAVLSCLFKPVDPSVMSDLRSIVRVLIKIRSNFSKEWGTHFENAKSDAGVCDERIFDFINTLNLFIYLIADYFQQKDLVMNL